MHRRRTSSFGSLIGSLAFGTLLGVLIVGPALIG